MKYKLKAKVEENEEAIKNGVEFEPITDEWMFMTLKLDIMNRRDIP